MHQSFASTLPLPKAIRRRAKTSAFCVVALCLIAVTFFRDGFRGSSSPQTVGDGGSGQHLTKYLPWQRPNQRPGDDTNDIDSPPVHAEEPDDYLAHDLPQSGSRLPDHDWSANGLLTVNHDGAHPIYELIRRAETNWKEKNRRASKTLEQAVAEYQRRYGRPPPIGFDHWWRYVQDHNVQLPDEYDQIYNDLEPYWGVDPVALRETQFAWEAHWETFTIGKVNMDDPVTVLNKTMEDEHVEPFLTWGASPQIQLLGDLWQYIPPFRATFSPHDAPNELSDWTWKSAALNAAKRGTYLRPEDLPPMDQFGFAQSCAPESPLRLNPPAIGEWPTPQKEKTFIHDHRAAMDACLHPQHLLLHGNFLSAGTDPIPTRWPAPQFSNCATTLHADIRAISVYMSDDFVWDDLPWDEKEDDRMVWRGGPTGMWHHEAPGINWRGSQRVRLVNLTAGRVGMGHTFEDVTEVIRYLRPSGGPNEPVGILEERGRGAMNRAMMDVGFSGDYGNCEGAACDAMNADFTKRPWMSQGESSRYKYVFDVDGNGWSARFRRLMSTHSLVFKTTMYPEWFTDRVQPWVHYVPVQLDYSDLYDSLVFFAGDLSGEGAHDEMARLIGQQGREWVRDYWRREDIIAYMFRMWLEYARLMSPNRNEMNFRLPSGPS